jgi:hypothetical protein
MKIVPIFEDRLYAFSYDGEVYNEYDRLMDQWTNADYLKRYAERNHVNDVRGFVARSLDEAEEMEDTIIELTESGKPLDRFFRPLHDFETGDRVLALRKGKMNRNHLRLYAVKVDADLFVITGGAIKMSQRMKDHPDTLLEWQKLNKAKDYLKENGIVDEDSFFELINEE